MMGNDKISIKAREALRHIRNVVMVTGGVPSIRKLMKLMKYRSPRSAMILMQELEENRFLRQRKDGSYQLLKDLEEDKITRTVDIPLVGSVPCGIPMLAQENIEAMIPVSTSLARSGSKYFLLRASGDSMDEAGIDDGDLILVRQQPSADNGQQIVALIDDEATVKEYHFKGNIVTLMPRSSNPKHKPIILTSEFQIQGIIVATIPHIN
jgi:repressor LexA